LADPGQPNSPTKLRIAIGELRETQDHLDKAVEEAWLAETPHGEMKHLADRVIGAAVRFAEYLDRNGEEWKKHYISRQRQEGKKRSDKRRAVDTHGGSQGNTPTPHRQEPSEPEEPEEPSEPEEPGEPLEPEEPSEL
jgi:hypothetical protein